MIRAIHRGYQSDPEAAGYPAHLHVDLVPCAQGQGNGRRMMDSFLGRLRDLRVPAVHLGVAKKNARAVEFYKAMGFHIIMEREACFSRDMDYR